MLLAIALAGSCRREARTPVAPFGDELAAPLPYRDVLGLIRFRPGGELSEVLARGAQEWPAVDGLGVLQPAARVLQLLADDERRFLAAEESIVILLLDGSVHGALAAFAWKGDSRRFRESARAAGLRLAGDDRVELPGRGRVDGVKDLAMDAARLRAVRELDRMGGGTLHEDASSPRVTYHLIERDGVTLLAPARDGARNLFATLAATRALEGGASSPACVRLDVGRIVGEVRDELRNAAVAGVNFALHRARADPRIGGGDDGWHSFYRLRRIGVDLVDGLLDLAGSTAHLFSRWDRGRVEVYLLAEEEGFLRALLPLPRNRPIDELVAGVPGDATTAFALSLDPAVVPQVSAIWRATQRGFFQRRRRPHRFDFEAGTEAAEAEEPAGFLASFGGRCWMALAEAPRIGSGEGLPFTLRAFTELTDDDAREGLIPAVLREVLPKAWMETLRLASITAYRIQRVPGGCVEAISQQPGAVVASEGRRLADPEPLTVPWDGPREAFAFWTFALPGSAGPLTIALTRDERGIRGVLTLPFP